MSLDLLFAGMDGDIKINNTVAAPAGDTGVSSDIDTDTDDTEQSADIAEGIVDAQAGAKDTEAEAQMILRMLNMYSHVRRYGIDRTFVSLYNRHGELNKLCGIQFPACESFSRDGNRYSQYSTAFIAAMEDGDEGLWAKVKRLVKQIIGFIVTQAKNLWDKIASALNLKRSKLEKLIAKLKKLKYDPKLTISTQAEGINLFSGNSLQEFANANKEYVTKATAFTKSVDELEQKLKTFINSLKTDKQVDSSKAFSDALTAVNTAAEDCYHSAIFFIKLNTNKDDEASAKNIPVNEIISKASKFCELSKGIDKSLDDIRKSLEDSVKKYNTDANEYSSKVGYASAEATAKPILDAAQRISETVNYNNRVKSRLLSAFSSVEECLETLIRTVDKAETRTTHEDNGKSSSSTESFDLAFL